MNILMGFYYVTYMNFEEELFHASIILKYFALGKLMNLQQQDNRTEYLKKALFIVFLYNLQFKLSSFANIKFKVLRFSRYWFSNIPANGEICQASVISCRNIFQLNILVYPYIIFHFPQYIF